MRLVKILNILSGSLITETCLYNFDPLKSHFYIHVVKLGFPEVYIIFCDFAEKLYFGYLLEPPRRANEY